MDIYKEHLLFYHKKERFANTECTLVMNEKGEDNQYHWMMCNNGGVMDAPKEGHMYYSYTKQQITGYPY